MRPSGERKKGLARWDPVNHQFHQVGLLALRQIETDRVEQGLQSRHQHIRHVLRIHVNVIGPDGNPHARALLQYDVLFSIGRQR